jgi:hypothetical protein
MDYPHTFNIFVQVFVDPPGAVIGQEYNRDLGGIRFSVLDRTEITVRVVAVTGHLVVVTHQWVQRIDRRRWRHRLFTEESSRGNA